MNRLRNLIIDLTILMIFGWGVVFTVNFLTHGADADGVFKAFVKHGFKACYEVSYCRVLIEPKKCKDDGEDIEVQETLVIGKGLKLYRDMPEENEKIQYSLYGGSL